MALAVFEWSGDVSTANVEDAIRSLGPWGELASIALMVVHSFVPFPAELIAFANGMIYGPLWGTVITWVGAMLGASIAFWLARRLGRPFVERIVSQNEWRVLDDWAASNGWQVVLVSRFIPVIAFNLINYAAGLTKMSWHARASTQERFSRLVLLLTPGQAAVAMSMTMTELAHKVSLCLSD